ncbi:MAG: hypothetical protein G01um101430_18 [Parcubacteria group bacterium Gr01-1014_30]|nr:MAG: hypothetical protein G01um101430_18 [Parcubacteria group bacterium Gr01-1014_30]
MKFSVSTEGHNHVIDITDKVSEFVEKFGVKDGFVLISCPGSTVGITTLEAEPNLIEDLREFLEKLVPADKKYRHAQTWGDDNAPSHIRSALIPPSLTVPIENRKLVLGQWQNIVLIDFDNRPRQREIYVQVSKQSN